MTGNILQQIETIRNDFRQAWKSGGRPLIEDYLNGVPEKMQIQLFRDLLDIEIKRRYRAKESPRSTEYIKRFPNYAREIRQVFDESTIDSLEEYAGNDRAERNESEDLTQTIGTPPTSRMGEYELIGELGRGGFGVVYEARHQTRNNRVALKTLPTGIDGQEVNADKLHKFRKEFRSLSEINHPNLVGMQTLEVDGNRWFFTMDLIEGEDFLSYVRPAEQLDEQRLRASLDQLATGIIALHDMGIVHRDLKPSNVLVDPNGRVVILDFGLVAQLQTNTDLTVSRSGMFAGTPKYAAPEQMFGERSEASDWYAFGTMLYEALSGYAPFSGNQMELLNQKQNEDPLSISGDQKYAADLAQLADGLLKRDPGQRLSTAEVVTALQLDLETRVFGSTQGSTGSSGSLDNETTESPALEEAEIVLIGRDEQLCQLEAAKREFLDTRQPMVVWISGKSGEGKSALVEKFLQPIRLDTEMLVLSGRCYDRESVPFKAIDSTIDPLASFLRSHPPNNIGDSITPNTQLLLRTFPILRRVKVLADAPQADTMGMDERQVQLRAFDGLRDLWCGIGKHTPIILFVDDLQWGDADSVEMLCEMLAGRDAPPVMLIGSFRSDERDQSPFWKKWNELQQQTSQFKTCEIEVNRLDRDQCLELLTEWAEQPRDSLPSELVRLVDESGGNPFLLELLFDNFQVLGEATSKGLSELVDNRLNRLPKGAKPLLQSIAVAGQAVAIEEAAAAAQLSHEPLSLLTHMRNEKLVRLIGERNHLRVDTYHDKVRETVLDQLDESARKTLHLRLAELIERQFEPSQETGFDLESSVHPRIFDLAYHFDEAGEERAFDYQLAAGQQALSTYAIDEALDYLEQAKHRLSVTCDQATEYQLSLALAQAYFYHGRLDESYERFDRALALSTTTLQKAYCRMGFGRVRQSEGNMFAAYEELSISSRLLGEPLARTNFGKMLSILSGLVNMTLVPRLFRLGRPKVRTPEIEQLLAETLSEMQVCSFTSFLSFGSFFLHQAVKGKFSDSVDRQTIGFSSFSEFAGQLGLRRVAARSLRQTQKTIPQCRSELVIGFARLNMGASQFALGQFDLASKLLEDCAAELNKICPSRESHAYHYLRHIESIRGKVSAILKWSYEEFKCAQKARDHFTTALSLYAFADGLGRMGRTELAIKLAREAAARLRKCRQLGYLIADQELGRALIQSSQYDEAREILTSSRLYIARNLAFAELILDIYPLLTESILSTNWIPQQAKMDRRQLRDALRMARKTRFNCLRFPTWTAHAYRVSGRAATAAQKFSRAFKYFDKGIAAAEKIGAHYERGRNLIDKSMLDYPDSKSDREKGIALLESLGCVLPDAEAEYLGLDLNEHHQRAAAHRDFDVDEFIGKLKMELDGIVEL